jgi:ABC-type transporter Mla subunit MlaD
MWIPGPCDVLRLPGACCRATRRAVGVVPRAFTLVGQAEGVIPRVLDLVSQIESLVEQAAALITASTQTRQRADALVSDIEVIQRRVHTIMDKTESVVDQAEALTGRVRPLLDEFQPTLTLLAPTARRIAETTSPDEVDAVVKLIDTLPDLVEKLEADILPVLDTLSTVAPDLRDLLDLSRVMNELLGAVPGLGHVKRRAEEEQAEEDGFEYRASEEPAAAPARRRAHPASDQPDPDTAPPAGSGSPTDGS